MPVPAETGFIEFKGRCPFKFENKTSAAKWQSKSYWLIPLVTHLSFRRTIPLSAFSGKIGFLSNILKNDQCPNLPHLGNPHMPPSPQLQYSGQLPLYSLSSQYVYSACHWPVLSRRFQHIMTGSSAPPKSSSQMWIKFILNRFSWV
jgi:hypothetical protein